MLIFARYSLSSLLKQSKQRFIRDLRPEDWIPVLKRTRFARVQTMASMENAQTACEIDANEVHDLTSTRQVIDLLLHSDQYWQLLVVLAL